MRTIIIGLLILLALILLDHRLMEYNSLRQRLATLEETTDQQLTQIKSITRPIIHIQYGSVYHVEGEIVVEERR